MLVAFNVKVKLAEDATTNIRIIVSARDEQAAADTVSHIVERPTKIESMARMGSTVDYAVKGD